MEESASHLFNPEILRDLVSMEMPFGKFKGRILCELPVNYVEWLYNQGLPQGKLGMLLGTLYEIKINGLEHLLIKIKNEKTFMLR
jgi:hypothetical protein